MAESHESGLSVTIRRLHETANLDLTEWVKKQDWLGRNAKDVVALEERLGDFWNLGRNVILQWAQLPDSIQVLVIPQFLLAGESSNDESHQTFVRGLLAGNKQVSREQLEVAADRLGYPTINISIGHRGWRLPPEMTNEVVKRYGTNYIEDQAVALFDIVGFSLYSPLEQVSQLNSLSYSLNSAHARMLTKERDINFARSTTGDGFYVWNRDNSIQANINLYHFMHLALADNAIARSKSQGNVTPELRAAFHVGSHYEFYQSEGLNPTSHYFIVGDVTIELARLVDSARPGQVLVGDFKAPMGNHDTGETERVDTVRFIELTQETLSSLEGLVLSGEPVDAIRCYLTGRRDADEFQARKYQITDKHGLSRLAYNAKINIYRENSDPIFLGLQDTEVEAD
jgi:class 3 adenylate cyclase